MPIHAIPAPADPTAPWPEPPTSGNWRRLPDGGLVPDDEVAQRSAQAVQRFAQKLRPAAGPETGARAAAQPARPTPAARPPAPVAPGLRYCVGCGVSMPASARYCPRCGERQPPG